MGTIALLGAVVVFVVVVGIGITRGVIAGRGRGH